MDSKKIELQETDWHPEYYVGVCTECFNVKWVTDEYYGLCDDCLDKVYKEYDEWQRSQIR